MTMQYGFYLDISRCTGCKTCQLACKDYKGLSSDVNFRRVYEYVGGDWQQGDAGWTNSVFAYYLSIACNHCADPACVAVCPTGAMHKRAEDGIVEVNEDICIGCKSCALACPYHAPQFDAAKGNMTKCNLCRERLDEGLKPVCVESCPLRALDFGPVDALRARHGNEAAIAPLPSDHFTQPSLVLRPGRTSRPACDPEGWIANPSEV